MEMLKYEDIKIFKDNLSSFKDTSRDSAELQSEVLVCKIKFLGADFG